MLDTDSWEVNLPGLVPCLFGTDRLLAVFLSTAHPKNLKALKHPAYTIRATGDHLWPQSAPVGFSSRLNMLNWQRRPSVREIILIGCWASVNPSTQRNIFSIRSSYILSGEWDWCEMAGCCFSCVSHNNGLHIRNPGSSCFPSSSTEFHDLLVGRVISFHAGAECTC